MLIEQLGSLHHHRRSYVRTTAMMAALTFVLVGCGGDSDDTPFPTPTPTTTPTPSPTPTATPTPSPSPSPTPTPVPGATRIDFDFNQGISGWTASYADIGVSADPQFMAEYARLPSPLDARSGYRLYGNNLSDDLFLYIYRPVTGLVPNTRYRIEASVTFASNIPSGGFGISEALFLDAGASSVEPVRVVQNGYYRVPFDKNSNPKGGFGGKDVASIGLYNIMRPCDCDRNPVPWTLQTRTTATADPAVPIVTSDAQGRLWLVIGTDSGFEVGSTLYFTNGFFTLTPV